MHVQRFQDSNERRDWQLLRQEIYFVNKCKAMFSTERLKIPSALESSAYLKLTSLLVWSQQYSRSKYIHVLASSKFPYVTMKGQFQIVCPPYNIARLLCPFAFFLACFEDPSISRFITLPSWQYLTVYWRTNVPNQIAANRQSKDRKKHAKRCQFSEGRSCQ